MYLLLMTFVDPSSSGRTIWEMFNDLEAASLSLARHKRETEEYNRHPVLLGPVLVQHCLLEVKEVQPCV